MFFRFYKQINSNSTLKIRFMWSQSTYIKQSKWKPHLNCVKILHFEKSFSFNFSKISENFTGINFRERPENYDFVGINFRERPKNLRNHESFYPRIFLPLKYIPLIPSLILKEVEKSCMLNGEWSYSIPWHTKERGVIEYDFDKW